MWGAGCELQGVGCRATGVQGARMLERRVWSAGCEDWGTLLRVWGCRGIGNKDARHGNEAYRRCGVAVLGHRGARMQLTGCGVTGMQGAGTWGAGMRGAGMPGAGFWCTELWGAGMKSAGLQGGGLWGTGL